MKNEKEREAALASYKSEHGVFGNGTLLDRLFNAGYEAGQREALGRVVVSLKEIRDSARNDDQEWLVMIGDYIEKLEAEAQEQTK